LETSRLCSKEPSQSSVPSSKDKDQRPKTKDQRPILLPCTRQRASAVDRIRSPGDPRRAVRRQKEDQLSNFLRLSDAAQRMRRLRVFEESVVLLRSHPSAFMNVGYHH